MRCRRIALVLSLLLAACAGEPRAPVEQRAKGTGARPVSVGQYTVVKGDTLYAIAWRFGHDYRRLARANGIAAPYTIYPGQKLVLKDAPPTRAARPASSMVAADSSSKGSKPLTRPSSAATQVQAKTTPAAKPGGPASWRWPTSGKVVRGFSGDVHKGIDIGGQSGDSVKAVATGKVVYAGNGIVGYGNLLIMKHSEEYLSAYGHNRRLLVGEGDVVKQGQRIAEKGSSATNSVKLHFEIRREGKPVDPVKLLPRRY